MNKEVFNRLVEEYVEVEQRYIKLRDFIARNGKTYRELPHKQKALLRMQQDAMEHYVSILKMRIELIERDKED